MNFELLHGSEVLSNYPHTGPQASEISTTIKAYGHVARIVVHVDHAYASQSYAYAKLLPGNVTIVARATRSIDKKARATDVYEQLLLETLAVLEHL